MNLEQRLRDLREIHAERLLTAEDIDELLDLAYAGVLRRNDDALSADLGQLIKTSKNFSLRSWMMNKGETICISGRTGEIDAEGEGVRTYNLSLSQETILRSKTDIVSSTVAVILRNLVDV
jgi:hypothetical protein